MNFFGIGGLEFLVIGAVALFFLGPKRLVEGIREARKVYSELKRQRADLQSMITEAIDLDGIKKQIDAETLLKDAKGLTEDLALDQVAEDVREATDVNNGPVARNRQLNRPSLGGSDEVRAAIPDIDLSGSKPADAKTPSSASGEPGEVKP
ncbi:MAG: hypothetical protein O3B95_05775 [Chloroflexi bacterium]|nr:hypothetical protein [Chloroflexota bacterium]